MAGKSGRQRRGPRTLTPDERRLWDRVAATTSPARSGVPREESEAAGLEPSAPAEMPVASAKPLARPVLRGRIVKPSSRVESGTAAYLAGPEVGPVGRPEAGLDRRTADRLRKGARTPDASVDLHGMSAERAHRACLLFLSDALARGCRMVLVITGKGQRSDERDFMSPCRGVLRESLPGWLRASALGVSIVGIYQAHQRHGGEGAFYVYLKKRR
ncbi:MAG: Smr/MutS family protein [Pseudomonadota bacterium]